MADDPEVTRDYLPRRFGTRRSFVDAIQYRPDIPNCGDVARFTGLIPPDAEWQCDEEAHGDHPWHLTSDATAWISDWIVKYGEDEFAVVRNYQFIAMYEADDGQS